VGWESLEHRTLLATLQFSGGLGEISTLDSKVQNENELSSLNASASQQFTHNDGTAVSNVTLTTAASTTGNPGLNADILSQGSVASNKPLDNGAQANVAVNTGLTDTSGNIGAAIPVTIVATNPGEADGDPVTVQFSFSFDIKTFASNNASANFSYYASYTYNGGLPTTLANHTYPMGGTGITPIGSGPVDLETGTLHAHIGDTFTLTFSENLGGQIIKSSAGAGISNVGWLIDGDLDASVKSQTKVVPISLTWSHTTDGGVDYSYRVDGPTLADPVSVNFYWASGTAYPDDILGTKPAYSTQIPAGQAEQGEPYGPVHVPGANLKGAPSGTMYLLIVTDPDNTLGDFDASANVAELQTMQVVPRVSQGDPQWADDFLGYSTNTTIQRSGCALSSLVMALDFAGVQTDPGSLNQWLTTGPVVGYSGTTNLNWGPATSIAALHAGMPSIHWNAVITSDPQTLRDLLTSTSAPVVVQVNNPHPADSKHPQPYFTSHFVLVTGIDGDTFFINDPGYADRQTLNSYQNTFVTRGYITDPPDVSSLSISASSDDPGLDLSVVDPAGLVTGLTAAGSPALDQIPGAVYFTDGPVEDLDGLDEADQTISQFIEIPQPSGGTFQVQEGAPSSPSELQVASIRPDGAFDQQREVNEPGTASGPIQYPVTLDPAIFAPQLSISNVTAPLGHSGTTPFAFTVILAHASDLPVSVDTRRPMAPQRWPTAITKPSRAR
jgi:hypothetical protein